VHYHEDAYQALQDADAALFVLNGFFRRARWVALEI